MNDNIEARELKWEALSEAVDMLGGGWLFRGQANAAWNLATSLERHTPADRSRSSAEQQLLRDFRRRAHVFLQAHLLPTNTGEWLATMQHFGAPTRLLDVTRSPYVAIYFAVEDATDVDGSCAVWAVNRLECTDVVGAAVLTAKPFLEEPIRAFIASRNIQSEPVTLLGFIETTRSANDWFALENRFKTVMPFLPELLSERLSIQQGEFVVPRDVDSSFMENLLAAPERGLHAIKFIISNRERPRILEQLRLMNITRASLFPGLDGFAQSFRQALIEESPQTKHARAVHRAILDGLKSEAVESGRKRGPIGELLGLTQPPDGDVEKAKKAEGGS
jgi:FRG domain